MPSGLRLSVFVQTHRSHTITIIHLSSLVDMLKALIQWNIACPWIASSKAGRGIREGQRHFTFYICLFSFFFLDSHTSPILFHTVTHTQSHSTKQREGFKPSRVFVSTELWHLNDHKQTLCFAMRPTVRVSGTAVISKGRTWLPSIQNASNYVYWNGISAQISWRPRIVLLRSGFGKCSEKQQIWVDTIRNMFLPCCIWLFCCF